MKAIKSIFLAAILVVFCGCNDDDNDYPYNVNIVKNFPTLETFSPILEADDGVVIQTLSEAKSVFEEEIDELTGIENTDFSKYSLITVCSFGEAINHVRVETTGDNQYRVHCRKSIVNPTIPFYSIATVMVSRIATGAEMDYVFYYD